MLPAEELDDLRTGKREIGERRMVHQIILVVAVLLEINAKRLRCIGNLTRRPGQADHLGMEQSRIVPDNVGRVAVRVNRNENRSDFQAAFR